MKRKRDDTVDTRLVMRVRARLNALDEISNACPIIDTWPGVRQSVWLKMDRGQYEEAEAILQHVTAQFIALSPRCGMTPAAVQSILTRHLRSAAFQQSAYRRRRAVRTNGRGADRRATTRLRSR